MIDAHDLSLARMLHSLEPTTRPGLDKLSCWSSRANILSSQTMLMHVQLDLSFSSPTFNFPASQRAAYADSFTEPIFRGSNGVEVNMNFVAKTLNFFKYHLTRRNEHILYSDFRDLPAEERIKSWKRKLINGQRSLGRNWKGVYSYLEREDLDLVRNGGEDEVVPDNFNNEEPDSTFQVPKCSLNRLP